jgi:hypothetical protein
VQQASGLEVKTPGISGRISQEAFQFFNQESASLKTSRATLPVGCITFCATWEDWVTEQRGAYSARLNAERHTRGNESLSWPTMGTTQAHISGQGSSTVEEVTRQKTFHLKQRTNKHGEVVTRGDGKTHQATLASAVVGVQNWPTPCAMESEKAGLFNKGQMGQSLSAMANRGEIHGLAAPASWPTPNCMDVITPTRDLTQMESKGHWGKSMNTGKLSEMVNYGPAVPASSSTLGSRPESWATPRAGKTTDENPETWAKRQSKGDVATMPLTAQVKQWQTATVSTGANRQKDGSMTDKLDQQVKQSWPTPSADGDSRPGANADPVKWQQIADAKKAQGINKQLFLTTKVAMQQSGKLNPRWVETLMGLPVGWTMPSCASPVTIAPTSCGYSETVLSRQQRSEPSEH